MNVIVQYIVFDILIKYQIFSITLFLLLMSGCVNPWLDIFRHLSRPVQSMDVTQLALSLYVCMSSVRDGGDSRGCEIVVF